MSFSVGVACGTICSFLGARHYGCLPNETIRYNEIAQLIIEILAVSSAGDESLCLRSMRAQVKKFVTRELGADSEQGSCSMSLLRDVINHFCDLCITVEHMRDIALELQANSTERKIKHPRRSRSDKSDNATSAVESVDKALVVLSNDPPAEPTSEILPSVNMFDRLRRYDTCMAVGRSS